MCFENVLRAVLLATLFVGGATPCFGQTPVHRPPPEMQCPGEHLVWVNTRSGVYHFQGERYFGSTRQGKFMCQRDADREGDRPTRNGQ